MSAAVRWLGRQAEPKPAPAPATVIRTELTVVMDGEIYAVSGSLEGLWGAIREFHRDALGGKAPGEATTLVIMSRTWKEAVG